MSELLVDRGNLRKPLGRLSPLVAVVLLTITGCAPATPNEANADQPKAGESSSICKDDEQIPVLNSPTVITRSEYIGLTEGLLWASDPFVGRKRGFAAVMQGQAYIIGHLEPYCPGMFFEAGVDGSLRISRPVPPSNPGHYVPLAGLEIEWGRTYLAYARLTVMNTLTGETTHFSLAEPRSPAAGGVWPTFVREGDEYPHPYRKYAFPIYPLPTPGTGFSDEAFDLGRGKGAEGYLRVGK